MERTNLKKIKLLAVSFLTALLAVSSAASAASAASFEDNTLIRGQDGKIFVVRQGQRVKVKDLAELRRDFRGKKIINVDDKTLAEIKIKSPNSGPSANSGRGSVRSGSNRGAGGIRPNNSLIRSRDGRIFVIEDNARRQIDDLSELRQEHLGQAIHDVDDDVVREFELRGRANEPGEDVRGNADDFVNGVKLRGDGTVDDNSTDSGRNRGSNDSSSAGDSSSGRGSSNSGGNSGSSGGSSDD